MSGSTAVTVTQYSHFLSAISVVSLCLESPWTQMHPKCVSLCFILGVCVLTLRMFILYAVKFRIKFGLLEWICMCYAD
jgi:hypothetical protein